MSEKRQVRSAADIEREYGVVEHFPIADAAVQRVHENYARDPHGVTPVPNYIYAMLFTMREELQWRDRVTPVMIHNALKYMGGYDRMVETTTLATEADDMARSWQRSADYADGEQRRSALAHVQVWKEVARRVREKGGR